MTLVAACRHPVRPFPPIEPGPVTIRVLGPHVAAGVLLGGWLTARRDADPTVRGFTGAWCRTGFLPPSGAGSCRPRGDDRVEATAPAERGEA